ncbi:hypothetical protein Tco_1484507 [Tanacetum coccineum]
MTVKCGGCQDSGGGGGGFGYSTRGGDGGVGLEMMTIVCRGDGSGGEMKEVAAVRWLRWQWWLGCEMEITMLVVSRWCMAWWRGVHGCMVGSRCGGRNLAENGGAAPENERRGRRVYVCARVIKNETHSGKSGLTNPLAKAMNIRTTSRRATRAKDSSKLMPSSCLVVLGGAHAYLMGLDLLMIRLQKSLEHRTELTTYYCQVLLSLLDRIHQPQSKILEVCSSDVVTMGGASCASISIKDVKDESY